MHVLFKISLSKTVNLLMTMIELPKFVGGRMLFYLDFKSSIKYIKRKANLALVVINITLIPKVGSSID